LNKSKTRREIENSQNIEEILKFLRKLF